MVAAHMCGWYGGPHTSMVLFPFVMMFGAFKARDGIATAVHGAWGTAS